MASMALLGIGVVVSIGVVCFLSMLGCSLLVAVCSGLGIGIFFPWGR